MSITLSTMLTTLQMEFKFAQTTKQAEATKAIQFAVNSIVDDFINARGLKTETSWLACTLHQANVDLSGALDDMYANRIRSLVMRNTAQNDDNQILEPIDYEQEYLIFLSDTSDPDSEHYGEPYQYARYKDNIYLKFVPDESTYEIKVIFEKAHPTITTSQDILLPADFEECIYHGAMSHLYTFVERKDGLKEWHKGLFEQEKKKKIEKYNEAPDSVDIMEVNWYPMTTYGTQVQIYNNAER